MKIIEAARLMDPLYLRQVWSGNPALLERLEKDMSALGRARLHYFRINVGPWSRLDNNEPFIEAKFKQTLVPISRVVLASAQRAHLSFDAFFTHILAYELMHGLGPHNIKVDGRETTVRLQLKELNSALEEAKADITGLFALQYLIDKGLLDHQLENSLYTTYLASAFRSVRFGISEAHGKGVALQFNYLMDQGAIKADERNGTFSIDSGKVKEAVRNLTHDIMTIQAEGSYENAKRMLDQYGVVRPLMQKALDSLSDVPVDIEPSFPLAQSRTSRRK